MKIISTAHSLFFFKTTDLYTLDKKKLKKDIHMKVHKKVRKITEYAEN